METESHAVETVLWDALESIRKFVAETTGQSPSQAEIARAVKRYFVLKEIKEHIEMERGQAETEPDTGEQGE
ncbi:MAG: hypothetical protein ACOZF0_11135 [Thermodesulfobacteriota bacterium]